VEILNAESFEWLVEPEEAGYYDGTTFILADDYLGLVVLTLNAYAFDDCQDASEMLSFTVNPLPEFDCPEYGPFTEGDAPVTFEEPGEFTYNGDVITGWDPTLAGTFTIIYAETNEFGCSASCEFDIVVEAAPICPVLLSATAGVESVELVWEGIDLGESGRTTYFPWLGGDATENTWSIYVDLAMFNGVSLQAGDEIAIMDGEKIVGVRVLTGPPTPGTFSEEAVAFKVLGDGTPGYTPGNPVSFKCWSASQNLEGEVTDIVFLDPYGDAYTSLVFPTLNDEYSIAELIFGESAPPTYTASFNIYIEGLLFIENIESTSYLIEGLEGDVEYCFTVTQNLPDGEESCYSNELCATPETASLSELVLNLTNGWNWISINVIPVDGNDLNSVLGFTGYTDGDLIQTTGGLVAEFFEGFGWFGNLETISPDVMYLMYLTNSKLLTINGVPVDVSEPIAIVPGWNWIGYKPQIPIEINTALVSESFVNGDIIQTTGGNVAEYFEGFGWFGNLEELMPGVGYLLFVSNSGSIIYPMESKLFSNQEMNESLKQNQIIY
jgi:hypothetical protein